MRKRRSVLGNIVANVLSIWKAESSAANDSLQYDYVFDKCDTADILVLTEHVNATYFLSFHFPLCRAGNSDNVSFRVLSQKAVSANIGKLGEDVFIDQLISTRPKTAIFTRYADPQGRRLMDALKHAGTKTIYHIDDDLLNIPTSLGSDVKRLHGARETVESRRYLLEQASLIYASTVYLRDRLHAEFDKDVVAGIYAPYLRGLLDRFVPVELSEQITVGYMGSRGHGRDLAMIVPAIKRILEEYPNVRFEVFGTITMPSEIARYKDRVRSHRVNMDYLGFLNKLNVLGWDIGLAPLEDNVFNRCKAPTKFVEYTACSIPTIASDLSVYQPYVSGGRGVLAKDDEWYGHIRSLIESNELRTEMVAKAHAFCEREFALERLAEQVMRIVN